MGPLSQLPDQAREPDDGDSEPAAASSGSLEQEAVDLGDLLTKGTSADAKTAHDSAGKPVGSLEELERILLQALMDRLPDVVYFKDLKSRFIMVNAALAKKHFFNKDPSAAVGRTDFDLFAHEHARKAYDDEQMIIATGKPLLNIEEKEVWPDGRETWALTSKYPLKDSKGAVIGTWGISRDITEQKQTEEHLKASEDQLRHAQKMEAFGQLAGGMAHDFNNMLSVILGASQLLELELKEHAGADVLKNIDMIIDTTKRGSDLTQQLLAFARRGKYKIVPIDLHEVIHSVVGLVSHTFDKQIRIMERLNARASTVMGDYAQLQNALLNLALNARDAMPAGGSLTFSTATVGPAAGIDETQTGDIVPGSFLRVRIIDTGIGMDAKTRAQAFEPFFTTKEPGKGTGLGLASVYGTVKNMNGIVECASEPDKGTTITMFLPLVLKPDKDAVIQPHEQGKKAGRILIVEDDSDLRTVLCEMLESLGYPSSGCSNGFEAVDYYREHQDEVSAVIVDLVMPRMGGNECIKRLKKINPSVKVMVCSGYNLVSDTQQIIARGIVGFIQKPYERDEIARILYEAVGGE
ncbi:MAG: response regulator [Chitinispirillaceae bacterium]|nr:response regulator [Chitinispirillaceae bacterium]